MQLFAQERVLPPTPRRLREARRRGEVARSADLGAALLLLAAVATVTLWFPRMASSVASLARAVWSAGVGGDWTVADVTAPWRSHLLALLAAAAPFLGALWFVAAAVGVGQTGGLFQLGLVAPRGERLNPVAGVGRLVSRRALVELVKSPLKLAVVGATCALALQAVAHRVLAAAGAPVPTQVALVGTAIRSLVWRGAIAFALLAVLDYAYQRGEHQRSLRMTPQEWRQDLKETEGDPLLRQRLRQRQRQLARRRMLQEVRRADVVVVNPTRYAVALRYDPTTMVAPVVVAKGRDHLAARIRQVAQQHGVPIVEEPAVARALYRLVEVGRPIPEELYVAVAEILAFVWRLRGYGAVAAARSAAGLQGEDRG